MLPPPEVVTTASGSEDREERLSGPSKERSAAAYSSQATQSQAINEDVRRLETRLERFVSKSSEGSDQSGRSPASAAASRLHSSAPASICVTDLPNPTQNLTVSPRRQEMRRQQQRRRQELMKQEQRRTEVDLSLFPSLEDKKERHVPKEIPHHPSIPFPKDPRNPLKTAVEKLKLKIIKKY